MSTTQIFGNGSALYNNGKVAISKDLIFGLCVYTTSSWQLISSLTKEEISSVRNLINGDPLFLWYDLLEEAYQKAPLEVAEEETEDTSVAVGTVVDKPKQPTWVETENMSAKEYLEYRETAFKELKKHTKHYHGLIVFQGIEGFVYAAAQYYHEGYCLRDNSGRILGKELSHDEVFAKVLRTFW